MNEIDREAIMKRKHANTPVIKLPQVIKLPAPTLNKQIRDEKKEDSVHLSSVKYSGEFNQFFGITL